MLWKLFHYTKPAHERCLENTMSVFHFYLNSICFSQGTLKFVFLKTFPVKAYRFLQDFSLPKGTMWDCMTWKLLTYKTWCDFQMFISIYASFPFVSGAVEVSVRSPIACWFSAMLYCFGGSVLSSLMLAEPPIAFLAKGTNILLATSVW